MKATVAFLLSVVLTIASVFPVSVCGAAPAVGAKPCPCCPLHCPCVAPAPVAPVLPDAAPTARDRVPTAPDWLAQPVSVLIVTVEADGDREAGSPIPPFSADAALPLFRWHCALLI